MSVSERLHIYFLITQAPSVYIDGTLRSDATDAANMKSGGGSGGSIFIDCDNLRGQGVLTVQGNILSCIGVYEC